MEAVQICQLVCQQCLAHVLLEQQLMTQRRPNDQADEKAEDANHGLTLCKGSSFTRAINNGPEKLKAACSIDDFTGLTSNTPTAPLPIIAGREPSPVLAHISKNRP